MKSESLLSRDWHSVVDRLGGAAVPRIAVNFGKPNHRELGEVKLDEIKAFRREGHFPPGSMGPKVDAAVRFLEGGGKRAIISHLNHAMPALRGETGTHIVHGKAS